MKALLELCGAALKVAYFALAIASCKSLWTQEHFSDVFCRQMHS